jgi:hypothetical protein
MAAAFLIAHRPEKLMIPGTNKRIILLEARGWPMDFYLQRLRDVLQHATAGLSPEQLERPRGEKWSAAQILEHLLLTYAGTIKGMEKCLAAGKPLASSPTIKQRVATAVVIGFGHMPQGRKAPERSVPRGLPAKEVLPQIWASLNAMDNAIARCERQFGSKTKIVDHPILGPLTAPGWRKFHWVHGNHHAKQIEEIKRSGEYRGAISENKTASSR